MVHCPSVMKNLIPHRPRAVWLLLAAPALVATPVTAQDAVTAPPPVRSTVTATPSAAPAPVSAPATTSAPAGGSRTVLSPEAQAALAEGQAQRTARPARHAPVRQANRPTPTRQSAPAPTPVAAAPAPAPVAQTAAPAPEAAPAPTAAAPAPVTAPPAVEPVAPVANTGTDTASTTEGRGTPLWPLALIVVAILAVGAFFLLRGRRKSGLAGQYEPEADYYADVERRPVAQPVEEPSAAYAAPAAAAAVVASPVPDRAKPTPALHRLNATGPVEPGVAVAEDATVTDAEAEEVAALTDGAAPVRNRPWLEFAMRPVRAGTSAEEALVEIELTVANSGNVPAQDVRVSTFMLTDANASEMERLMVAPPADSSVDPLTIQPGEGTRIDATLAALKADVGRDGDFTPVVVADARYRLPDGSEGRTSASFLVGVSRDGGTLTPFDLGDQVMRDDIEARLHGEPQHA